MPESPNALLVLNFVPINVDPEATLCVGVQPYSDAVLRSLRHSYAGSHYFRRDHERDAILAVRLSPGTLVLGATFEDVTCGEAPWLVAPLALEALLRYFHEHGRRILDYKPLRMVTKQKTDDLLRQNQSAIARLPVWLQQRVSYEFDTRLIDREAGRKVVLLACDVR